MKSLQNLGLARKFALIGAVAALMTAIPATLALREAAAGLHSAQEQLAGVRPSGAMLALVRQLQQHRGLSAGVLGGNQAMEAARSARQAEVDQAMAASREALQALGAPRLVQVFDARAQEWKALAAAVSGRTLAGPESFARHTALVSAQLELLQDITHESGIVLIAEPSSYFLQDGVLSHLPRLTEILGQMRALGSAVLSRGQATPEERQRVAALGDQARSHQQAAGKMIDRAAALDAALHGRLGSTLADAGRSLEEGLKLVDERIVRAASLDLPAKDYFDTTTRVIDAQFKLIEASFDTLSDRLQAEVAAARWKIGSLAVTIALLATLGAWLMWSISRATVASITLALRAAESVAAGDLATPVGSAGRDEAGRLLQAIGAMQQALADVVGRVRANAQSVATASTQIAQGNQDLSSRTEQTASNLQQTASSMEQLTGTVKQSADSARQANQLAASAAEVAQRGGSVVSQVVSTMDEINASSKKISDIIGVIDGIAFQTNILALNAAVEAARAGEQGRGFAVVASEVRSLAQRSAEAAREIKGLIGASVDKVETGSRLVSDAGSTMNEIVASVQRVSDIIGEITAAAAEQSDGIGQVNTAVTQLDQMTQQNAALVEESAAAAESLREQAQRLEQTISAFRLGTH